MKIGNGRGSSGKFTRKDFKLKDGEQIFRILPGIGELADSNRWSVHYSVHWGYKSSDGKKIPFASPEQKNRKTGMIEAPDAAKDRLNMLKAKFEEAKKANNKEALDQLNPLVGREGLYNLDSNHHINVIDFNGNIGVLKIRHKCKLLLDAEISKLEKSGVYPLSPEDGRFFVFTRTGMGNETSFGVKVLKEKFALDETTAKSLGLKPGTEVERDVVHTLTDDVINRLSKEAGKLDQLFGRPTSEQVTRIVETSVLKTGVSSYLEELVKGTTSAAESVDAQSNNATDAAPTKEEPPAPIAAAPEATSRPVPVKIAPQPKVSPVVAKTQVSLADMDSDTFLEKLAAGTL